MPPQILLRPTPRWTQLRPHKGQYNFYNSDVRFNVVPAGRRSGKSEIAKRRLVRRAIARIIEANPKFYDAHFFAAAPTRDQAKRIYWADLKALVPKKYLAGRPKETDLIIPLINRVDIQVVGLDKPERIEGSPWDGGILDEYGNMKPEAWRLHVRPALSDRNGWCDLIGVPEGRNHYYDMYKEALADTSGEMRAHHWLSSEILSPEEIESAKRMLDPLSFAQEYQAEFVSFSGQAYYPFNPEIHCKRLEYNPKAPLIFAFDFNVEPGVAAVLQEQVLPGSYELVPDPERFTGRNAMIDALKIGDEAFVLIPTVGTGVIGEVWIPSNSNTPAVVNRLIFDWGKHQGQILIYGDASGGSRGTAKTLGSDWDLVKQLLYTHYGSARVFFEVPKANPSERARINAVNSRLKSMDGVLRLMVDPEHAPHVVNDFEGVRLLEGGSGEIDKKRDRELSHMCFAGETLINGSRADELSKTGVLQSIWGLSPFVNPGLRQNSPLVKLTFEDGKTIRCTPDHLIITASGWKQAQYSLNESALFFGKDERKWTQSHTTGLNTIGTGNTLLQPCPTERKKDCIPQYGNCTTGQSLEECAFITLTATEGTMSSKICALCQDQIMPNCICPTQKERNCLQSVSHCQKLKARLLHGTNRKKAENGIGNTAQTTIISNGMKNSVTFAENLSKQQSQIKADSVHKIARRRCAEKIALTLLARYAPTADESLNMINTFPELTVPGFALVKVINVENEPGLHPVYCPTVEAGHFFLDNGLMVSNSDAIGYYIVRRFPIIEEAVGNFTLKGRF